MSCIQVFEQKCVEYYRSLETLYSVIEELPSNSGARDTASALQSRLQAVQSASEQRVAKMQRLVDLWAEMEDTAHQMELWLQRPEFAQVLNSQVNPSALSEEELCRQLDQLKVRQVVWLFC